MFAEIKTIIRKDSKVQLLLLLGFIVQLITSITQPGFYHPDQHFQVIEFSSHYLGNTAYAPWELAAMVRPTIQVHIFTIFYQCCNFFKVHDPYIQLTILRVVLGCIQLLVFNTIALYYFKNEKKFVLYVVLGIMNLSWILPYTRTLYSSEMLASLFFFGSVFLYEYRKERTPGYFFIAMIGFLLCLAFYFRFQVAFAIAGFGLWIIFFEKKYKNLLFLAIGFLAGVLFNTCLDYNFYKQWVFTPYKYFDVNIVQGVANSFGTSSFLEYIAWLLVVITAPVLSIILFYYSLKSFLRRYDRPLFIATILFITGHCFIGHKEDRFMFPIFNILPVIAGWGIIEWMKYYEGCKKWVAYMTRGIVFFSLCLNMVVLIGFMFIPYAQTIHFSEELKKQFKGQPVAIYCLFRTPLETESRLPMVFYKKGIPQIEFKRILQNDSVRNIKGNDLYVAGTYNDISKKDRQLLDSLRYKPILFSSATFWKLNEYLESKELNCINDIWVLYKKK